MTFEIQTVLIKDLWKIIIEYVDGDVFFDFDWDNNAFDWASLSSNPSAVYILEKLDSGLINYTRLADNHSVIAMEILEKKTHLLDEEYNTCNGCGLKQETRTCIECDGEIKNDNGWEMVGCNPFAFNIIEKYLYKIDEISLVFNTSDKVIDILEKTAEISDHIGSLCNNTSDRAISIIKTNIEKYIDKIDWGLLSSNSSAMDIIENNIDKIDWSGLSSNTSYRAINIIENNLDKVDWKELSSNTSYKAINILKNNMDKIDWENLANNKSAISLIEKKVTHIMSNKKSRQKFLKNNTGINRTSLFWFSVCRNPSAIHIIEKYIDKVDWNGVSDNPAAIHIIEQNIDKINYAYISRNNNFFKEYPTIKLRRLLNID